MGQDSITTDGTSRLRANANGGEEGRRVVARCDTSAIFEILASILPMKLATLVTGCYSELMKLHTFRSKQTFTLCGLTIDPTGANLPKEDGPWDDLGSLISLAAGAEMPTDITEEIERCGFALLEGDNVWQRA
ncbi:hypothetical protein [Rhodopila sp.]|uniref:hypothetical protein n=1 Tax=Rhodopila sp. TaxID=2480087 RepID=UPI003D0EC82E